MEIVCKMHAKVINQPNYNKSHKILFINYLCVHISIVILISLFFSKKKSYLRLVWLQYKLYYC